MSLHWQPVGPEPDATYWRRRVLVALAALVILFVALQGLSGGDDDELTTAPAPPAAEPTSPPSADPVESEPCPAGSLEVAVSTDAASYEVGGTVELELTVRNTGDAPCGLALGQGEVELLVTSGEDRIWSSTDCEPAEPQDQGVLEPGGTQTSSVTWSTVRSAPDCPPDQPEAEPGTYRVNAQIRELVSDGAVFTLG